MEYIYFEIDNLTLFINWLQQRPEGQYNVIIGRDNVLTKMESVLKRVGREEPELVEWLKQKRSKGEIILGLSKKMKVPQGVISSERP